MVTPCLSSDGPVGDEEAELSKRLILSGPAQPTRRMDPHLRRETGGWERTGRRRLLTLMMLRPLSLQAITFSSFTPIARSPLTLNPHTYHLDPKLPLA